MTILLNNEQIMVLPDAIINEIIKFMQPHPVAQLLKIHITNLTHSEDKWVGDRITKFDYFATSYFNVLERIANEYRNCMEIALIKIAKTKFIKQYTKSCSCDCGQARNMWKIQNNIIYDSDGYIDDEDEDEDDDEDE